MADPRRNSRILLEGPDRAPARAMMKGCDAFVVLVGRDRVRRWIGAETEVALIRQFAPHDDARRLPIFPILLGETSPEPYRRSSGCSRARPGTVPTRSPGGWSSRSASARAR